MGRHIASVMVIGMMVAWISTTAGGNEMKLTSPAFDNARAIPQKYSCEGNDINPALKIEGAPEGTKSFALIVDDPDAPMGTFVHWVVYNIPPVVTDIGENSVPGTQGINGAHKNVYVGPCPPSGTHRYFFTLYALDTMLTLKENTADKGAVIAAVKTHEIATAQLMGTFSRGR